MTSNLLQFMRHASVATNLFTGYCLLVTVYWLLFTGHCLLVTVYWSAVTARDALFNSRSLYEVRRAIQYLNGAS